MPYVPCLGDFVCVYDLFMYTWHSWVHEPESRFYIHGNFRASPFICACDHAPTPPPSLPQTVIHTHTHMLQAQGSLQFFLHTSGCSLFLLLLWSLSCSLTKSDLTVLLWSNSPFIPPQIPSLYLQQKISTAITWKQNTWHRRSVSLVSGCIFSYGMPSHLTDQSIVCWCRKRKGVERERGV